jgi:hydrophobic/amphiphilic exporter-1 (mainly G- bacteria), HAE1 family
VIEGGRRRLRPILMTAIATIFALLPMALGMTGEGGFISQPLAIVVIGGLISSTLLTLVLVPTLYTIVERTKEWLRERWADRRGRTGDDPAAAGPAVAVAAGSAARPVATGATGSGPGAGPAGGDGRAPGGPGEARPIDSPSRALIDGTDQFEVLRLPKTRKAPPPPDG